MRDYKSKFFELALRKGNLGFGSFTLKSGRISPHFFNAGGFDDGASLGELKKLFAIATDEPLETKIRQFSLDDIKGLAVLLASDASAYINGENILMDGGMHA